MSPATLSSSSSTAKSPANPPSLFRMKGTFTPTYRVKVPFMPLWFEAWFP
jgi:hypothetical protein